MSPSLSSHLQDEVRRIGGEIVAAAGNEELSIHPADWFDGRIMEWAMADEALKVQLFRFIDVLPTLRSSDEVARHLEEYFVPAGSHSPVAAQWGIHLAAHHPVAARAAALMVRTNAERMAGRFIAGDDLPTLIKTLRRLRRQHRGFTVDLLGEASVSESEAAAYEARYLEGIDGLCDEAAGWKPDPVLDEGPFGAVPRVNVSVKLSSLFSQIDPGSPDVSSHRIRERLRPLLSLAIRRGAAVTIDMEQYSLKGLTIQVFREILDEPDFAGWGDCSIALQAYLRETEQDVRELIAWASRRSAHVGVRLVRGAYWDYETVIASQRGWPVPVFTQKAETDLSYERCLRLLLEAYPQVHTAAASHNVRSLALCMALCDDLGLPQGAAEIQMLYGMADPIKKAIVDRGWRLRVYTPFGDLLPGMAYLVRRLLENTSNSSFLRMRFNESVPVDELLAPPVLPAERTEGAPVIRNGDSQRFENEPDRDFSQADKRQAFGAALEEVRSRLGKDYPLVIGGHDVYTGSFIVSCDPSRPSSTVGRVASAGVGHAGEAVQAADAAFPAWRDTPVAERASILRKAAAILRSRRDEMASWEVFEVGKNQREADADVTESIDYLEYYASEAVRWSAPRRMGSAPGEVNTLFYEPRGVAVVIPPWNFPLAILTGMTSAALAAGNTVVLKPASQSPVIGAWFMRILQEAGIPPGVLNFVPGPGGAIGDYLVDHPDVAMIAFTGSREIGERILQRAAVVHPWQPSLKYVIAEMGGKNAVIVDSDADLDDAVTGVVASAFGYAGQKCSACSRVICVGDVYPVFLRRLVEAAGSLSVGPADDPSNVVGPVIDDRSRARIKQVIEEARESNEPALEVNVERCGDGYFIGPTIFKDVDPSSALAREEIFGPVLSLMGAATLDEALIIANGTPYALTGGIYSRSPANVERACREFRVGNLYINRKITGALVGRQPFGGFKMSGTDIKAGGPDYLPHFMLARTITENTLRRGFAPAEEIEE